MKFSTFRRVIVVCALTIAAGLALDPEASLAEQRVHGADAVFSSAAIRIAWAVLKTLDEQATAVRLRIVNAEGRYRYVGADGIDPFTKDRTVFAEVRPLVTQVEFSIPRQRFAQFPSCEIRFFASASATSASEPDLTVFYLGVPDTTPEFASEADVSSFLDRMVGR